jgi:hypothetical protein
MLRLVVSLLTNIRPFWWHALFWTRLHLNCRNVCLCSSPFSFRSAPSATPWKPIFFTVCQTSYFSPPISFPVKFQNYIFFERRFIKLVARHYIVYNFPVTSFFYPIKIALPVSIKYHIVLVMCFVSKILMTISKAGNFMEQVLMFTCFFFTSVKLILVR